MLDFDAPVKDLVFKSIPEKILYEGKIQHYFKSLKKFGGKILYEAKKRHYYNVLKNFRETEEKDMAVLPFLVEAGEKILDIGANIGIYTRLLSRLLGPEGEVPSIEAVPATFGILEANVQRLGLNHVNLLNYAVSDTDGIVSMEIPDFRGFYRAKINDSAGEGASKVKVGSIRLDSLFAKSSRPISFIKCDVEGHELNCIKGAVEITEKWKPAWLMEVGDNPDIPGSRGQQVLDFFLERGYLVFWFDGHTLRSREFGDSNVNYFMLQPAHLEKMRKKGFPLSLHA